MSVLALIDCNNFFVSCERLFRPDLEGKPVVVLSSNDGCAVSRSNEAKLLGIPMGAPAFKFRQLFRQHNVAVFSANFELYGDISQRLTQSLKAITPRIEIYSVDESFLDLNSLPISNYEAWGRMVRERLLHDVGIPVSIGIAPTKTLAKLATEHGKRTPALGGVLDLASLPADERRAYLLKTPVKDVWGIGWRLAPRLRAEGVNSALDVAAMRPRYAQQLMGIHGRQMVAELNGTAVWPFEPLSARVRQSIMHGRMFGEDTDQPLVIEAAVANLTARAAAGLRAEGLLARTAAIHLSTNRNKPGYQRVDRTLKLPVPSADTGQLIASLVAAVEPAIKKDVPYHRVNILLYDLVDQNRWQLDLLEQSDGRLPQAKLAAMDALNDRYGRGTLRYAAEDLSQAWLPKKAHRSQHYTSSWDELPLIRRTSRLT
ncbi:MAG TPA: Y-family DNA polymerase [Candidatus Saccharimonadales bacterium]|nr:Y-family DNA polymerase [Candidatus Saccharimonadales bacterium]